MKISSRSSTNSKNTIPSYQKASWTTQLTLGTRLRRPFSWTKVLFWKCSKSNLGNTTRSSKTSTWKSTLAKVTIFFNSAEFRQSTVSCLKVGGGPSSNGNYKGSNTSKVSQLVHGISDDTSSRLRSRSKSPINERINESSSARKNALNVNHPVLHYFETG